MKIDEKYICNTKEVETSSDCWNKLHVMIMQKQEKGYKKIGEYHRNYSHMYNTFVPFQQRGQEFALYSADYTATRIMRLPSCEDVCGEERSEWGFCPVDYYVPYEPENGIHGDFGFIAGCVWGDDSSWKVEFLDLRRIEEGLITRDNKFGYVELPYGLSLKDCIDMSDFFIDLEVDEKTYSERIIKIATRKMFLLDENYDVIGGDKKGEL